jgi:HSP20 family protein
MSEREIVEKNTKEHFIEPLSIIAEDDGKVKVTLEMPEIPKEMIDIRIENDRLIITGKRPEEKTNDKYIIRERPFGNFRRIFTIDETIDRNKIEAAITNGILTVTLNIKEAEKPRTIAVKAG